MSRFWAWLRRLIKQYPPDNAGTWAARPSPKPKE